MDGRLPPGGDGERRKRRRILIGIFLALGVACIVAGLCYNYVFKPRSANKGPVPEHTSAASLDGATSTSSKAPKVNPISSATSTASSATSTVGSTSAILPTGGIPAVNLPAIAAVPPSSSSSVGQGGPIDGSVLKIFQKGGDGGAVSMTSQAGASGQACYANSYQDLVTALQTSSCDTVTLGDCTDGAYKFTSQIEITRKVTILGTPSCYPLLDCGDAERCFHVSHGAAFTLINVRAIRGAGVIDENGISTIKGGVVYVDATAAIVSFKGVVFQGLFCKPHAVDRALRDAREGLTSRVFGGHVMVVGGSVVFTGCIFWDTAVVMGSQFFVGGNVLVLAGNVITNGCMFMQVTGFSAKTVVGGNIAVLGGVVLMQVTVFSRMEVFSDINGAGHNVMVGGGVMVMDGVIFGIATVAHMFTGFGTFFLGGGVMVMNGVAHGHNYVMLFGVGGPLFTAVGGGVLIMNGVAYLIYAGPSFQAQIGGYVFVGAGVINMVGCFGYQFGTTSVFFGEGGYTYNGAGTLVVIGTPVYYYFATWGFFGIGGIYSLPAGIMIFIGNSGYIVAACAALVGQGVIAFQGAGMAVFGGNYYTTFSARRCTYRAQWWNSDLHQVSKTLNFWVHGCGWTGELGQFKLRPQVCTGPKTVAERFGGGGPAGGGGGGGAYGRRLMSRSHRHHLEKQMRGALEVSKRALGGSVVRPSTNDGHVQRGLQAEDDDDDSPMASFYVRDVHLNEPVFIKVPPKWPSNETLVRLLAAQEDNAEYLDQTASNMLIGRATDCAICGLKSGDDDVKLEGIGAAACNRQAACDNSAQDPMPKAFSNLQAALLDTVRGASAVTDSPDNVVFTPTIISRVNLKVTCYEDEGGGCASGQDITSAIKDWSPRSLQVTAVNSGIDKSLFAQESAAVDDLQSSSGRTLKDSDCGVAHSVYTLFITDGSDGDAKDSQGLLANRGKDLLGALFAAMPNICAADFDVDNMDSLKIPAFNSPEAKSFTSNMVKRALTSHGVPGVDVFDASSPDEPLGPNNPAVSGVGYSIQINGFRDGAPLQVQQVSFNADGKQSSSAVRSLTFAADQAPMLVDWTPDQPSLEDLTFIRVLDDKKTFIDSTMFHIGTEKRRILVGHERIAAYYN